MTATNPITTSKCTNTTTARSLPIKKSVKGKVTFQDEKITNYLKNQQWDELRTELESTSATTCSSLEFQHQTLVLACQYGAPPDIIKKIVQTRSDLVQTKDDKLQQTPLHILCQKPGTQERNKNIQFLAERYPQAAIIMDANGNTPLHLMCQNPCDSAYAVSAIEAICLAGPAALTMENHDDETPMELFLMSQATAMTVEQEEYQDQALKWLCKTNIMFLSNFKTSARGEMYRLQCCQQAVYKQQSSFDSCVSTDDESEAEEESRCSLSLQ
eukprot:CAMPEP_0116033756 /NCGR_PEP_ID=MMETSP0321-20121206/19186_1 /TAXON_ID=163516 /ORGANISM="Leptocylindrus danicus var. danicus, Strain B650" /LENGTH=270 /DNA_ID=CAMNT_0003509907 /DNA_START=4 /DNA_END=819 /DNA_ORIENTATION=-